MKKNYLQWCPLNDKKDTKNYSFWKTNRPKKNLHPKPISSDFKCKSQNIKMRQITLILYDKEVDNRVTSIAIVVALA